MVLARWCLRLVEVWLPRLLLIGTVAIVSVDVVLRYVFNSPMAGATEIAMLFFVWTVFLGGAVATTERLHVGFEALTQVARGRLAHAIKLTSEVLVIAVLLLVAVLGVGVVMESHRRRLILLDIPYSTLTSAIPVGCVLMALRFSQRAWASVRGLFGKEAAMGGPQSEGQL